MKTGREYVESLRGLKPRVFAFGERIEKVPDHPLFKSHISAVAMTYELAHLPEYQELMCTTSHLSGERINRFTSIHQGTEDLLRKIRMMRLLGQKTGTCFQRCVGFDGLNAVYATTYDMDQKYGTDYHQRFQEYLRYVQENDLMVAGAMSDPKGDRSKPPHLQADPDLYVRVVRQNGKGITVRGAKVHITGTVNSHEVLAMPTRALREGDRDYAVCFAVPVDAEGVTLVFGRQTNDTRRLEGEIDPGNPRYGIVGGEAMIVFEDVFVPWERVFMCGEYEFAAELVEIFAGHHRSNYGGCKVGVADVVIGASAWLAEAHGVENAPHIVDLLSEMINLAETCWACSLTCAFQGRPTPSGAYVVDPLMANVTKLNITRFNYEWMRLAQDIAGGLIITLPSERDYRNPELKGYMDKYFQGKPGFPAEPRMRMMRLVEALAVGAGLPEALHGAGSPQAQKIMIRRRGEIGVKRELAQVIAGLKEDEIYRRIWG